MKSPNKKPVFAEERRISIVELITERGAMSVADLCAHFNVSPATMRSDLHDLDTLGRLVRTHGGAMPVKHTGFETNLESRQDTEIAAKRAIAALALECIEEQDTVFLDVGTTIFELSQLLCAHRTVRVVTNDLKIGYFASSHANIDLKILGGSVRTGYHCTIGASTVREISDIKADKVFLATNGFDLGHGASTPNQAQAEVKKAMIEGAQKTYLLCDSSKFGLLSFARFAEPGQIDVLVTDKITRSYLEEVSRAGIEVICQQVDEQ